MCKELENNWSKNIFEDEKPDVKISLDSIDVKLEVNDLQEGQFNIYSENNLKIIGSIYSDSDYIKILDSELNLENNIVKYICKIPEECSETIISGEIFIITNGGEFVLPYNIQKVVKIVDTSVGPIKDLFQFASLAQINWDEALSLFKSSSFENIFLKKEMKDKLVYDSLIKSASKSQALDEFLVYLKKKDKVILKINEQNIYVDDEDDFKVIKLKKSTWGHFSAFIEHNCDFIELTRTQIGMEDFKDGVLNLPFKVLKDELSNKRADANGYIKICNSYMELKLNIIYKPKKSKNIDKSKIKEYLLLKKNQADLMKFYLKYKIGMLTFEDYSDKTLRSLEYLITNIKDNYMYKLYALDIYILQGNKEIIEQEMQILNKIKPDKNDEELCYYSYLKAKYLNQDSINRACIELVKDYYTKNPSNLLYFYILMNMDSELIQNPRLKYEEMKNLYSLGVNSPIIYYEFCEILWKKPGILKTLGSFEVMALRFGIKYGFISDETSLEIVGIANLQRRFSSQIFYLLLELYDMNLKKEYLTAVCSMLIKGGKSANKYHKYYESGIENSVRLVGINEYYLRSLDLTEYVILPESLLIYFSYNINNLSDRETSYLFANIVYNRDKYNRDIYCLCGPLIEEFLATELLKGIINDDLAYLYSKFLNQMNMSGIVKGRLTEVIFKHKIVCKNPNIRSIIVTHSETEEEERVALIRNQAYVDIFTENYCVTFVDDRDIRYVNSIDYEMTPFMDTQKYSELCYKYNKKDRRILLYLIDYSDKYNLRNETILESSKQLLSLENISKQTLCKAIYLILEYYYEKYDSELLDNWLNKIDLEYILPKYRNEIIERLIGRGFYDKAFSALKKYGYKNVSSKSLLHFASRWCEQYRQKDEMLLNICIKVFNDSKYDEIVLEYLINYYNGNIKNMFRLWNSCKQFLVNTTILEERILKQSLFTGDFSNRIFEIFESYYDNANNLFIINSYLKYYLYKYLIKDEKINTKIFDYARKEFKNNYLDDDVCKASYLLYQSNQINNQVDIDISMVKVLLKDFLDRNILLPYFEKFKDIVNFPKQFFMKSYLMYKSKSNQKVFVSYKVGNKDEIIEPMYEIIPGIYIKEFILFYDEKISYFITENNDSNIIGKDKAEFISFNNKENEGVFYNLNLMIVSKELKDDATLIPLMNDYIEVSHLLYGNFKIL